MRWSLDSMSRRPAHPAVEGGVLVELRLRRILPQHDVLVQLFLWFMRDGRECCPTLGLWLKQMPHCGAVLTAACQASGDTVHVGARRRGNSRPE